MDTNPLNNFIQSIVSAHRTSGHGGEGGFTSEGKKEMLKALELLVSDIKEDIREELLNEYKMTRWDDE
jgi:hypothetical protein